MALQWADWTFAAEARSVPQARKLIAQELIDVPGESLELVLLLTSELVTNAVRHGAGMVGVHVGWGVEEVRVEVDDESSEWPVLLLRRSNPFAETGRGLMLVDDLSAGWGVVTAENGKTVWFTLRAS